MSAILHHLYHAQGGECFYCGQSTWLMKNGAETKDQRRSRLGLPRYTSRQELKARQATREHLIRRADGGDDAHTNLVMACARCNHARMATPALLHLARMREQSGGST